MDGTSTKSAPRRLYRRLKTDHLALRATWPELPHALIHRLWLLSVQLPEFSPRHGMTHASLVARSFALDVELALDFCEPSGGDAAPSHGREHAELFAPMRGIFGLGPFRSAAVPHEVGAFA